MEAYLKSTQDYQQTFPLGDFVLLGKDSGCQIQVNDETWSERHARIEKKENQFYLKDLRSSSGTYINEARIMEALINDGDFVRLGGREFVFCVEGKPRREFELKSKNPVWNDELQQLAQVAQSDFPVLILGPSGTGKEVITQKIHEASPRNLAPLVSVNCSALTETLIESELFGHVKGSFTGAINDRKGAFEAARGGTLFLDEIGDLPYSLQAKLLRALENSEIRPVGSDRTVKTDVRIIAATHQNLTDKIQNGQFRTDLYYRLNVINIHPPALICRMEDFDDLFYEFSKLYRVRFSHNAILRLKQHEWPGNIRELKNLVARASALYGKEQVNEFHIEKLIDKTKKENPSLAPTPGANALPVIKEIERQMIITRMTAHHGNQRRTAQDLGMPKSTLHDRLKSYNIDPNSFKS